MGDCRNSPKYINALSLGFCYVEDLGCQQRKLHKIIIQIRIFRTN